MEFKFRATDKQPNSMYPPPQSSSTFSHFTDQAIRAGNCNAYLGRNRQVFSNLFNVRETIQRELEKERIREEIIASEIARKRALVEEVRIEMMIEREMAMRRGESLSYPPETSRLNSRLSAVHQFQGVMSLEERIAFSLEDRFSARMESLPFHCNVEPTMAEVTLNTNLGTKRKSLTPLKGDPIGHLIGKAKKPKEEWSCAICQVSVTSERLLNEHLQGKRHKAKEAAFRTEKEGKNFSIGLIPKEKIPSSKPQERGPQSNQKGKNIMPTKGKKENVEMNGGDGSKKYTKPARRCASEYKFWCEICEIGVDNEKVMEDHKMGKKHQYRLKKGVLGARSIEVDQKVNETSGKVERGVDGSDKEKSEFVLRCVVASETCEYGCQTEELMECRKMDKEHQARVEEVKKKDGSVGVNECATGQREKLDDEIESTGSGAVFATQSVEVDEEVDGSVAGQSGWLETFDSEST